jgi:signal transduction histidine kinase
VAGEIKIWRRISAGASIELLYRFYYFSVLKHIVKSIFLHSTTRALLASSLMIASLQFATAQNWRMDSLQALANKAKGKDLVDLTNKLAFDWYLYNVEKSYELSSKSLAMAKELNYTKGIAEATLYQGIYKYLTGNSQHGKYLLLRAQKLAKEAKENGLEGYAFIQLGNLNRNLGKYDSAKLFYDQSYEVLKDSLNPWSLGSLYGNLGKYYSLIAQPKNEVKYLLKAYDVRAKLGDKVLEMDALLLLSAWYSKENEIEKSLAYLTKAENLISKNTPKEIVIDVKNQKAKLLLQQGSYEEALPLFEEVKLYFLKNSTSQSYVNTLTDIGYTFEQIGNYESSQKIYFEALKIAKEKKFLLEETKVNIRIGWSYYLLRQYEIAAEFILKALVLSQKNKFREQEGNCYNSYGLILDGRGKYDEAQLNIEKGLLIAQEINNRKMITASLSNLAEILQAKGEFNKALSLQLKGLEISKSINDRVGLTWWHMTIGSVYKSLKNFEKAKAFLRMAEKEARTLKIGRVLKQTLNHEKELFELEGNLKDALQVSKQHDHISDSIFNQTLSNKISNLQSAYELEQKDLEIELLSKSKRLQDSELLNQKARVKQQWFVIATIVFGFLFVSVVALLLLRNNKRTNSLNRQISERKEEIQVQAEELTEANNAYVQMNLELAEKQEELAAQSEEMARANEALSLLNKSLAEKQDEIVAQNEELVQSNEEIATQRDLVSEQYKDLEEARAIIAMQNQEIKLRNDNLEVEIGHRTKELVEYNQQLEQFAFISSHNLRAPVARILGLGQLLGLSGTSHDDEVLIRQKLIYSTLELDRVVRDLNTILEIKKNNSGVITEVDLEDALSLIKINLAKEVGDTQATVTIDFSAYQKIRTIRPYLDSILFNLLSNAIKYRHPDRNPIITIKSEVRGDFVCLIVKDNGLGINLALYKDKLFTLYRRFHDHVEGKGLGLYLVKTQVTSLGGLIELESEVNFGTTFYVYLKASV